MSRHQICFMSIKLSVARVQLQESSSHSWSSMWNIWMQFRHRLLLFTLVVTCAFGKAPVAEAAAAPPPLQDPATSETQLQPAVQIVDSDAPSPGAVWGSVPFLPCCSACTGNCKACRHLVRSQLQSKLVISDPPPSWKR